ncbi:hypothetical protein P7C73_g2623, partial [Tremellales sp. Uapishka_1]
MSVNKYLIVGSGRGIGLALVEEIVARDVTSHVYATVRDPSKVAALDKLVADHPGRITIIKLDMTHEQGVKLAAEQVSQTTQSLDMIICNGGVFAGAGRLEDLSAADLATNLSTNLVGSHNVSRAFSPFLLASHHPHRVLGYVSSIAGSISNLPGTMQVFRDKVGVDYFVSSGYAISKSGLNMLARQWATVLEPQGVAVVVLSPGWVLTDLNPLATGDDAISPAQSAAKMYDMLSTIDIKKTYEGIYAVEAQGEVVPW